MRFVSLRSLILTSSVSLTVGLLSGCGMSVKDALSTALLASQTSRLSGKLHGGPNPIQQANITLWETWTTGIAGNGAGGTGRAAASASTYGSAAYSLGTTTTDSNGSWTLASFNCDAGEYLYVTATGGKTASNSANPNEVLVAPLGACSDLPTATETQVNISELSTLAMAYALGNFTSEDAGYLGGGVQKVYIGAPATNNAATAGCTGTGSSMSCVASGLAEGFADAISLTNSTSYTINFPAGAANTVPTDANGNPTNATGSIPAAMINTLGNVLQSCVNTSGGAAPDSSNCGKLFTATTAGGNVPTDTLQAAISIAQHPANSVHSLYTIASTVGIFTPTLTAEPSDYTLAITYTGQNASNAASFGQPIALGLLANGQIVFSEIASGGSGKMTGIDTNGVQWANVGAPASASVIPDNAGNVYTFQQGSIFRSSSSTLSLTTTIASGTTTVKGGAVDLNNNFYSSPYNDSNALAYVSPSGTTVTSISGPTLSGSPLAAGLAFDASQNLWAGIGNGSTYVTQEFVTNGSCVPPAFCATTLGSATTAPASPIAAVAIAADGSAWGTGLTSLYHVGSNGVLLGTYSLPTNAQDYTLAMDGTSALFSADAIGGGIYRFDTTALTGQTLNPCSLRNGTSAQLTVCNTGIVSSTSVQVDAEGALWVADYSGSQMTKVLGVAAPAWPYLGYAHPGVKP
ncbi:hypothetical protein SAMN05421819_3021 [Bryocella elongata]|uniref:Uncharacterized protein n=1 Tax=Bryocella elongata TaxID=863522 RepID=A0A1H6A9Z5_9BACT|nr:hypothetical protein [Bryocella elongata]SEG45518.1 hypothetical protein SAMN05421819_3021 [Bryocella elongata]